MKNEDLLLMKKIYDKFGISIYNIPVNINSELNQMVKYIIKMERFKRI